MADDDELRSVVQSALDAGLSPEQAKQAGQRYASEQGGFLAQVGRGAKATAGDHAKSFGYGAARGATFGFSDRLAGAGAALANFFGLGQGESAVTGEEIGGSDNAYEEGRGEFLSNEETARQKSPVANVVGQVAGGIAGSKGLSPVGVAATRAAQGSGTAVKVGAKLAQPALEGALAGAGNTREDDAGEMLKNAATGAGIGTAVAGATEGVQSGIRGAAGAVKNSLGRRVLNEAAEGTANTTATGRKRLDKAGSNIVSEVVEGPDSETVRNAYLGGAKAGREKLAPVIDQIGQAKDEAYAAFEKAGRSEIDMPSYQALLQARAKDALEAGDDELADAITAFGGKVQDVAARTGGMPLPRLRSMTTKAQRKASSVLGGLNEHDRAQLAGELEQVATEAMDETLSAAANGVPELEAAATAIRENNKRFNALLTIDKSLKLRGYKEETGKSALQRVANAAAHPAALGAVGGALTSEDQLEGAVKGAAIGGTLRYGIPAAARALDRSVTTGAIKMAQGKTPISLSVISKGARAAVPPFVASHLRDQDEKKRRGSP